MKGKKNKLNKSAKSKLGGKDFRNSCVVYMFIIWEKFLKTNWSQKNQLVQSAGKYAKVIVILGFKTTRKKAKKKSLQFMYLL